MLIIGNSHVSLFESGIEADGEDVEVRWLGALRARNLLDGHPAGPAVRERLARERGKVAIFVGNHDIQDLWRGNAPSEREKALERLLREFEAMFAFLSEAHGVCWLVGPQQVSNVGASAAEQLGILDLERRFREAMVPLCKAHGVEIIDPLALHRDERGRVDPALLQADGLHLRHERSDLFLEPLSRWSGKVLRARVAPHGRTFDTSRETGSLAALVLGGLGLPPRPCPDEASLVAELLEIATELVRSRGDSTAIDVDTDLVSSGLLDSLDLADLHSRIHARLRRRMDFAVELRELPTVRAMARNLRGTRGPSVEHFVVSLEDPPESLEVARADEEIARGGDALLAAIEAVEREALPADHPYRILDHWKSLLGDGSPRAVRDALRASGGGFPLDRTRARRRLEAAVRSLGAPRPGYPGLALLAGAIPAWSEAGERDCRETVREVVADWLRLHPDHVDLLLLAARLDFLAGRSGEAKEHLDKLETTWPWSADAEVLRAEIDLEQGALESCLGHLKEAVRRDNGAPRMHATAQRLEQAMTSLAAGARASTPSAPPSDPRLVERCWGLLEQASDLWMRGDTSAELLLDDPDLVECQDAKVQRSSGLLLLRMGRTNEARSRLLRATRVDPLYAPGHLDLGVALTLMKLLPQAEVSLRRAVELDDRSPEAWKALGHLLLRKGEKAEGVEAFARALETAPDDVESLQVVGGWHALRGDSGKARAFLERAVAAAPGDASLRAELAALGPAPVPGVARTGSFRVSAVVSTYNSAEMLDKCLQDLADQTIFAKGQLEVVVVDSGSPQDEAGVVAGWQARHPGRFVYLRTERETLYAAWNRGFRIARGRFVTKANTDDSHRPDALEILADALEAHPEADLAFADCIWTETPNELWDRVGSDVEVVAYPDWHPANSLLWCSLGPHPMWTRRVFDRIGWFDPTYTAAGDFDFQIRFVSHGLSAVHVPVPLSLFYQNTKGLSQGNTRASREVDELLERWRAQLSISRCYAVDPSDAVAVSAAWATLGLKSLRCGAPWSTDHAFPAFALDCFLMAHEHDPSSPAPQAMARELARALGKEALLPSSFTIGSTPLSQCPAIPEPPPAVPPLRWSPPSGTARTVRSAPSEAGRELPVQWCAPILNFSGYARMNRDLVRAMELDGIRPGVVPLDGDQRFADALAENREDLAFWMEVLKRPELGKGLFVCSHLPPGFPGQVAANPAYRVHVGLTMFETDRLPAGWARACEAMDEIWVPSTFNRETFARGGLDPARIQVVPYGIDLSRWNPAVAPMPIAGRRGLNLLAVFEWTRRKGWDVLVEAFAKAFGPDDDVSLTLRTRRPANDPTPIREQIEAHLRKCGLDPRRTPPILVLEEPVSDAAMPSLYAACDAVVLPTRGEGWGLPFMEAMAMERPVVATDWGAHTDFLDDSVGWMIPVEGLEPVDPEQTRLFPLYGADHRWARPSVEALVAILRGLPASRDAMAAKGRAGRARLAADWTPGRAAGWIRERASILLAGQRNAPVPRDPVGTSDRDPAAVRQSVAARTTSGVEEPGVLIRAGFFDFSGYSRLARDTSMALRGAGHPTKIEAFTADQEFLKEVVTDPPSALALNAMIDHPPVDGLGIAWFPPTEWQGKDVYALFREWHPGMRRNVALTMFETDRISAEWAARCNGMDEVWVPSAFNVETFAASGVHSHRMRVIPLGLKVADYDPAKVVPMPLPGPEGFTFLSVFQWTWRKGWDLLLEAFAREFADDRDVKLVLRTYPSGKKEPSIRVRIDEHLASLGLSAMSSRIHLVEEFVSDARMPSLLAACDAFVLPTRGEGWGIPFLEAMALGKPVVATRWSGHLEFMDDSNSFLVDIEGLEHVQDAMREDNDLYTADHRWAKPSLSHLRARMREVVADPERARARGETARRDVVRDRDISRTAAWIHERALESVEAAPGTARVAPSRRPVVAVDARALFDRDSTDRGIGHYAHNHLKSLEQAAPDHEFLLLGPDGLDESLVREHLATGRVRTLPLSKFRPGMADRLHLVDPMGEREDGISPFDIPFGGPRSTVFYDLIPLRFYLPHWSEEMRGKYLARLEQAKAFDGTHLCISEATRRDLQACGVPASRTGWIGAGLNRSAAVAAVDPSKADALLARLGITGPFFLHVGALDAHKNFQASLSCFLAVRERVPCQLVVVGRKVHSLGAWARNVESRGIEGVVFTDFLSREDLEALYSRAVSLLFLSRIEGFGFPLLEAMAQGCPGIAYANSSLPEVGGDAAVLVPDNDEVAVVKAMLELLADPAKVRELSRRGRERASTFPWSAVAERTLAAWSGSVPASRPDATPCATPSAATRNEPEVPVLWGAPVFDPSGYADEARGFLKEIPAHGISVALREGGRSSPTFRAGLPVADRNRLDEMLKTPAPSGCTAVVHLPAHGFQRIPGCGHHVGRTMFETDSLPASWVDSCNAMDEIWVPTDFNLRTFREAGVRVPLLKVHGGVDSSRFRPGLEPLSLPGRKAGTTYLSVFEWTARKGWDVLLEGWARAFKSSDDVRLVIRAYPPNAIEGDPAAWVEARIDSFLESIGRPRATCAPIVVLAAQVPDADMPRLYAAADVYLAPSRGEGWGRPHMEAMSCGVPVVATAWSGNLEFQDEDNSWLIPVSRVAPVGADMAFEIYRGQSWAEPDTAAFVELLQRSWKNRSERSAKAARARADVVARWDWKRVAPRAATRLREIAAGIPAERSSLLQEAAHSVPPTPPVRWCGPLFNFSGYARLAREAVAGLMDAHAEVTADPLLNDPEWFDGLRHDASSLSRWKELLQRAPREGVLVACDVPVSADGRHDLLAEIDAANPGCSAKVAWTMFETDRLPTGWAAALNRMDQVWVPSRTGLEAFRKSGVDPSRLRLVPGGVDPSAYDPKIVRPTILPGPARATTFLSVFQWGRRKGWETLLEAWARAFDPGDDVRLVLRCHRAGNGPGVREQLDAWLHGAGKTLADLAPVLLLEDFIPEPRMAALYAACDVFVLPSRGEGWGLPYLEAMASGKPCIATAWGGHTDFLHEGVAWMLPVEGLVAPDTEALAENPFLTSEHRWAEVSTESLVEALRAAHGDPAERARKGATARMEVQEKWTRSHVARAISAALADLPSSVRKGTVPARVGGSRLSGALAAIAEGLRGTSNRTPGRIPQPPVAAGTPVPSLSLRWEGSQFLHHSLAHVNRELCLGLAKAGHDLSLIPYEPDQFGPGDDPDLGILAQLTNAPLEGSCQVHVRHQWPPNLQAPAEGRWVVIQPWEFGSPPVDWVRAWKDTVDELWAYTSYVRDMYVRAGMPVERVHVVPLGVDVDRFRPGIAPLPGLPPKRGTRFLFVGGTIARKGFDKLLNAWQKAFGPDDDVDLVIKDMGGSTTYKGQTGESWVRKLQDSGNCAPIHYFDTDLPPDRLPSLYASADVLVHPYRGEGFGLPLAEAMACGLPVVATAGGAADDFCGEGEGWKIPSVRSELPGGKVGDTATVEPAWWLEPDEDALVAILRAVASDPSGRARRGAAARRRIVEGFTWAHAVEVAQVRLAAIAARPVRRQSTSRDLPPTRASSAPAGIAPDDGEALSSLLLQVESAAARRDFAEADRISREAVEAHPGFQMAWVARAMVLRGMGRPGEAMKALVEGSQRGDGPEARFEIMLLNLLAGKTAPARVQWNFLKEHHGAWLESRREEFRRLEKPWPGDRLKAGGAKKAGTKSGRRG